MNSFASLFFVASLLLGFIPPPDFVWEPWFARTKEVKTLHVRLSYSAVDSQGQPVGSPGEEELWFKKSQSVRRVLKSTGTTTEWLLTPSKAIRIVDGKSYAVAPSEVLGVLGLFYFPENFRKFSTLTRQLGIPGDSLHLTMKENEVCYEMGTKESALWLRKDVLAAGGNVSGKETHFLYSKTSRYSIPFPEEIKILESGKVVAQENVLSVDVNTPIPESTFELPLRK